MAIEADKNQAEIGLAIPDTGELIINRDAAAIRGQGSASKMDTLVPTVSIYAGQEKDTDLIGFFAIGVTINLIMVTSFFLWAFKQWKQN